MQRLSVLITKTVDCRKDLKQKLVFVTALEQRQAKCIVIFWKVKEFNVAIKKEMIACKVFLHAFVHGNNEDEEMSDTLGPTKNKDVSLYSGATTPISNYNLVDEDDSNLDAKQHAYETVLIAFSHN